MKVMILCGGYGARLSGVGQELPKPMIPIGGRPMLWHIMKGFSHWGFKDFVLCLGYRSDLIKNYFLNLTTMVEDVTVDLSGNAPPIVHNRRGETDWRITLAETGHDSMTGCRIKRAADFVPDDDDIFAVTYGDGVSDVDFREVVRFHRDHGKLGTLTAVHPPGRFGEIGVSETRRVTEFNEKPQAAAGWISGGFFVFSRSFLERLDDDVSLVLEEDPLRQLAREGQLFAYLHEGFWFCMDTPRDYQQLSNFWSRGQAPWAVWKP
jgi:glucose-1-phosphate cytidylyltransferase